MKYDVFISYSSHDQKVVEGLCAYQNDKLVIPFVYDYVSSFSEGLAQVYKDDEIYYINKKGEKVY